MRISGGTAKGRKVGLKKAFLTKAEGEELRPTSAKVRQAIFNILGNRITDAVFLDLYAGTGAVGIEALSRGADKAVFVEETSLRVNIIKEFVERFGFKDKAVVVRDKAHIFLKRNESVFDIVFLDPPYDSEELEMSLSLISDRDILGEGGIVIAEHSSKKALLPSVGRLDLKKSYKYGDTSLSLYKKD